MDDTPNHDRPVELLQQLGLKEYEARSFVALARRQSGTAKAISETSDVPRTRVYDAIRVLESKGFVETQHSNPQVFRAVSIDEAVATLRNEYEERADALEDALRGLEPTDQTETKEVTHEVWALSGGDGITSRTEQMVDDADEELVFVLGHESVFTERLTDRLQAARERGVNVVVGTVSESLSETVHDKLPGIEVFVSGLEWLRQSKLAEDETEISRLVMADREAILVSSFTKAAEGRADEQAVFGRGFDNGVVTITRRLMTTGLFPGADSRETN